METRHCAVPRDFVIEVINHKSCTPCHAISQHRAKDSRTCSETTTTATTLPPGGIGRSGGDVLDTSDAHAGTGKSAESGLGTGAGRLGAVTTSGADLDVESGDAEFLAASSYSSHQYSAEWHVSDVYAPTSWAANMAA
jgi:hypothetical protein